MGQVNTRQIARSEWELQKSLSLSTKIQCITFVLFIATFMVLDWWEEFLITHNAQGEWPDKTPYRRFGKAMTQGQKDALKAKCNDMGAWAKDQNGLARKLDCADRTGAQGNTDNGPVARYFFQEKSRPHVVNLFDYDEG